MHWNLRGQVIKTATITISRVHVHQARSSKMSKLWYHHEIINEEKKEVDESWVHVTLFGAISLRISFAFLYVEVVEKVVCTGGMTIVMSKNSWALMLTENMKKEKVWASLTYMIYGYSVHYHPALCDSSESLGWFYMLKNN